MGGGRNWVSASKSDWRKEPFSRRLTTQAMNDFLASLGFVMKEMRLSRELAEEYGFDLVELEGGYLVACERG